MFETVMAYGQIIIADLILSGDNALIIGMAAAGLSPKLRKRAILYGMVIAAVLRIVFAVIATTLLDIPGILFIGSVLLFWVCWRLFQEIRDNMEREAQEAMLDRRMISSRAIQVRRAKPWRALSSRSRLQMCPCPSTMFSPWPQLPMATSKS